jgi:glycosyltransferase involved in cell wall biosynthesis
MGIPQDATVVGSFQKDGLGWGAGNKPKLEKGPDIFCDAIERLAKKTKVFVLLSGPARGYVINRLKAAGIRYYHTGYLDHANDVAEYYRALDLYLITSRLEGGPKSALEAPASGIPLISTQVGMIPDIAKETSAIIPVESFDASEIAEAALSLLADDSRMRNAKKEGPRWVESYDWTSISKRYESELYKVFYDSTKREI